MELVLATVAAAQESRVLLVYPESPSPLLSEALVHVRGELGSVGLSVQVITTEPDNQDIRPELPDGTYGALVFEEHPGILIMRAYHPGSPEPTTQQVATHDGRITPHVAGVRAVETLRAALQQYYYTTNRQVPDAVKKIARITERPPAHPSPSPPPARPPPPPPAPSPPPPPPRERRSLFELNLWLAPALTVDVANERIAGAGIAAATIGRDWYFAGIELQSTVLPFELSAESGSATIHRHAGALDVQGRLQLTPATLLYATLGGGVAYYRVRGQAEAGYEAQNDSHLTAFGALSLGAEYRVGSRVGLYAQAQGSAALDAPYLRFSGVPTERFERPLLIFCFGVSLGLVR